MSTSLACRSSLPETLPTIGGSIVAAIKIPHREGYLPDRAIVVCRRDMPDSRAYSTHEVCRQYGHWTANAGHYEMSDSDAMSDMMHRAGYGH